MEIQTGHRCGLCGQSFQYPSPLRTYSDSQNHGEQADSCGRERGREDDALAKQIRAALPAAPILLVANKVDQASRKVSAKMLKDYEDKTGIKTIEMSTKSNFNFEEPLKWAARQMVGPVDEEGVSV